MYRYCWGKLDVDPSRVLGKLPLVMSSYLTFQLIAVFYLFLQNRLDALQREQAKEREETENKIKGLVNEVRRNADDVFGVKMGFINARQTFVRLFHLDASESICTGPVYFCF